MAHQIRTYFLLLTFIYFIACDAAGSGCGDDPKIIDPGGGDDDATTTIVLEMYRCGTQFRSVRHGEQTGLIVIGEGGIAMAQKPISGRFYPIYTGIANDLNDLTSDDDHLFIFGEGLTPDEPGIIRFRSVYRGNWRDFTHPARGGFTDHRGIILVTNAGEILLQEDGWRLLFEEPGGESFYGVTGGGGYLTAVGDSGLIYRNENSGDYSSWLDESIENGPNFRGINRELDPQDALLHIAYAVGDREIWRRIDGTWERVYNNANGDLFAIEHYGTRDDFWVAGTNGTILHYDGSTWQQTPVGADVSFRGISTLGGHAVGNDGVIYNRHDVDKWSDLGYSNISPWNDIDGLSTDQAYAANGDTLMEWDGTQWGPLSVTSNQIVSLWVVASDQIWVATQSPGGFDNYLYMWNGSMFQFSQQSSIDRFNSIWCDESGDTVMVATANGFVHKRPPGSWDWMEADPQHRSLFDLWGTSAHDVFAVGASGLIVHFDGIGWTEMTSGVTDTLRAISGPVAVGNRGAVTRYDGSSWHPEISGVSANLNAVWYFEHKNVWAVGDGGVIIHYDGSGWTAYERDLYTVELRSVWGADPDDIWIGGETGYLLRYQP